MITLLQSDKNLLSDIKKIEFWIATGIFIMALFSLLSTIDRQSTAYYAFPFDQEGIPFHFFSHYFIPRLFRIGLLYGSFLLLNFSLLPAILKKESRNTNLIWLFILFVSLSLVHGVLLTYSRAFLLFQYQSLNAAYLYLFAKAFVYTFSIFLLVGFYVAVKVFLPQWLRQIGQKYTQARIYQECLIAATVWLFIFLFLLTQPGNNQILAVIWFFCVLLGILQYGFSLSRFIPDLKAQGKGFGAYLWRSLLLIALVALLFSTLALLLMQDEDAFTVPLAFNMGIHALFTTPFCWMVYNYKLKNKSEIQFLKTELGKSDASLSFLQSQINPHFLFNALNTLYGTALQEDAERTAEGVQKLGDMMRFMLHENVKDKILLSRDIDYLENYIGLQKLRTSRSANMTIETQIEAQLQNLEITPMLLIPFVENAFKHGISLQSPSYIKISLQTKGRTLYFDVHNSIHLKADNDPEKLKSGIGLQNVKQRLALLYPGRHELIIRETGNQFFIHLTLQL